MSTLSHEENTLSTEYKMAVPKVFHSEIPLYTMEPPNAITLGPTYVERLSWLERHPDLIYTYVFGTKQSVLIKQDVPIWEYTGFHCIALGQNKVSW